MYLHREGRGEITIAQDLDRPAYRTDHTSLAQRRWRDVVSSDTRKLRQADWHVLNSEWVVEAATVGEAADKRRLATFKPRARLVAGTGLLALDPLAGIRTVAAGVAAADALAVLLGSSWGA